MERRGPTQGAERHDAATRRWESRPWRARLVRLSIVLAPITVAVIMGWVARRHLSPERVGLNRWIWLTLLMLATAIVATGLRRALHRLAPLAALMELTLVFPDQAPSRSKAVLRRSSSRSMLRRLEEARSRGDQTGETAHGEYLVQLLQEVNDHDRLTRGHSERVRAYAEMLGEQLGLDADEMNKLRWAALLHDVGKLEVPAEILNKDGRPTEDEWKILSAHPSAGGRMLAPFAGWLGEWVHAADQHHCRWDGKGYPDDLAGDGISLPGRIVAVADAYDVMTSSRSYKKPLPTEVARKELTDCAGSQFDPAIVRAFLNISLGRLQAVAGPFAGLAHLLSLPQVRVPIVSSISGAAAPVLTMAAAIGLVGLGDVAPEPIPPALAMEAGATVPADHDPTPEPAPTEVPEIAGDDTTVQVDDVVGQGREDESIQIQLRADGGSGPLTFRLTSPTHGQVAPQTGAGAYDRWEGGWTLTVTYTPTADFAGTDELGFDACDPAGDCATGTIGVDVVAQNDAPRANDDSVTVGTGLTLTIDALANDVDVDLDRLELVEVGEPEHGSALIVDDTILYRSDDGYVGDDRLTYAAADPHGATSSAEVQIGVTSSSTIPTSVPLPDANLPPTVQPDQAVTDEDMAILIDVLANDADADGDALSIVGVGSASRGTVTIEQGQVRYVPDADLHGLDTFLYAVSDGINPPMTATGTVTVLPVNDAPTATIPAAVSILESAPAGSTITSIATADVDGDPVSLRVSAGDPTGRFAIDGLGNLTTAGAIDHETTPSFDLEIEISDGSLTSTATTTVQVADVNEVPVAVDDGGSGFTTDEDTRLTTPSLIANDNDPDGPVDPATIMIVTGPANGTATSNGDGTFDYDPDPQWSGTDQFTYTVFDNGPLTSNQATVTLTVTPVNDRPLVTDPGSTTGAEGTPLSLQIMATDIESNLLSYAATGLPSGLTIDGTGRIAGTPGPGSAGLHAVTVTVTDNGSPAASTAVALGIDLALHEASSQAGAIVINEVLATTVSATAPEEFVELHNPTASAVDLTGWTLDDANLKADGPEDLSYTIAATDHWGAPSTLAAGGYAVVWLVYDGSNLPPLLNTGDGLEYVVNLAGTKLGDSGDDVWLLDPDTRIVDYMAYGAGAQVGTPPEAGLGLWDATHQAGLVPSGAASIVVTPSGANRDLSACWEPVASGDAGGRCTGALPTIDSDQMGSLATSVGRHNNAAADAGGPYTIAEGATLTLDGSGSTGAIAYAWDLDNDGSYDDAFGASPAVTWSTLVALGVGDDGTHPVGLQVGGGDDTVATTLTITNVAPTLTTTGAATATDGGVYTLTLGSTDPGADTITSWTINWGDGTVETLVGNPSSVTHTYTGQGFTYDILASATDEDGTHLQNQLLVPSYTGDEMFRFGPTGSFLQRWAVNNDPVEALIGPDGKLYVSAEISNDVLRYDARTGAFIDTFVTAGSGGLNGAEGMAFGPDGNLYLGDWGGNRIQRFDATNGAPLGVFASGSLNGPYDLLFGPDLDLYVTSYNADGVVRYDGVTGAFDSVFVASPANGGLDSPEQAVFGPDGNLYVASFDSGDVLRYDGSTGALMGAFIPAGGAADLDKPSGLAFGPDGNFYVGDFLDHVILRFDGTTGAFIDEFVAPGTGGLTNPVLMTFLSDRQVTVVP